eukprot:gene10064-10219_t
MAERLAPSQRHMFVHGGRTIYEWDQTLTELNMYIPVPPDMKAKEIFCDISKQHIKFGRKGNPPFLDGEPWPAAIHGHELDPITQQQDQQRLLLERFQRE